METNGEKSYKLRLHSLIQGATNSITKSMYGTDYKRFNPSLSVCTPNETFSCHALRQKGVSLFVVNDFADIPLYQLCDDSICCIADALNPDLL